jgi:glycine dehydrogenase subunit 2
MHDLQEILADVTGMKGGVSLAPMAGAQGVFAGVAMIMAYHKPRRPAPLRYHAGCAPALTRRPTMCGHGAQIPTQADGDIDVGR